MKYLDATIKFPPEFRHPMERFLRDSEAVHRIEILAWDVTPGSVEYALAYVDGAIEPYRRRIESVDSIRDATLSPVDGESFHAYVCQETRESDEVWRQAFEDRSLVVVPPVVYDGNGAGITVVGAPDNIRTLLTKIPDRIPVTVEEVGDYDRRHATIAADMTDRQFEVVSVALEMGYYEVPREAGLADVADALGCAQSTVSNLLRKAEGSVMRRLVGAR
jgi:predicted DNA binding protein